MGRYFTCEYCGTDEKGGLSCECAYKEADKHCRSIIGYMMVDMFLTSDEDDTVLYEMFKLPERSENVRPPIIYRKTITYSPHDYPYRGYAISLIDEVAYVEAKNNYQQDK